MRIRGSDLRRIIKEEITRAVLREEDAPRAGYEIGMGSVETQAAVDSVSGYLEKLKSRIGGSVRELVMPMAAVLQGKKVITDANADINDALLVGSVLGAYARAHPEDKEFADAFIQMLPTMYNEDAVRIAQAATGASPDGKFGRQTLVSIITDGQLIISPSNLRKLEQDPNYARSLAMKSIMFLSLKMLPAGVAFAEALEPTSL